MLKGCHGSFDLSIAGLREQREHTDQTDSIEDFPLIFMASEG